MRLSSAVARTLAAIALFAAFSTISIGEASATTSYTITFVANFPNAGTLSPQVSAVPTPLNSIASMGLSRAGYQFLYWSTNQNGTGTTYADEAEFPFSSDSILFAQWQAPSYAVTFNESDTPSDTVTANQIANSSTPLTSFESLSPAFSNPGYTFNSWNTEADGSGINFADSAAWTFLSDLTLFAQWAPIITFNSNGGDGNVASMSGQKNNSLVLPDGSNLTRTGFEFLDWNTASDGSGTSYQSGSSYLISGPATLYAQWSALVNFSANGGTGSVVSDAAAVGGSITLPSSSGVVRPGDTFSGWSASPSGVGTLYAAGAKFVISNPITLYASWSSTVTFDGNGATGTVGSESNLVGTSVTLPSSAGFTLDGGTFLGWNTSPDGSGSTYQSGNSYGISGATTLYAQWKISLTFSANGAIGSVANKSGSQNSSISIPSSSGLTRSGYDFTGWNTSANGSGTTYQPGNTFVLSGPTTLYAQWTAPVSFVSNGASGGVSGSSALVGTTITVPPDSGLTRTNFSFTGWNTSANGSGTAYQPGNTFVLSGPTTLYAQWSVETASLSFVTDSIGQVIVPSIEDLGSIVSLPLASSITKSGHHLVGWSLKSSSKVWTPGAVYSFNAAATFIAVWAPNQSSLTLNSNGAAGAEGPLFGNVGDPILLPGGQGFHRAHHSFVGWAATTSGTGTTYVAGEKFTLAASNVLYAEWAPDSYEVGFSAAGAAGHIAPLRATFGVALRLPGGAGLVKAGVTFVGWSRSASGTSSVGPLVMIDSPSTFYAVWKVGKPLISHAKVVVRFNDNGGIGHVGPLSVTSGHGVTIPSGDGLHRAGYSFRGWATSAKAGRVNVAVASHRVITHSITLYAVWSRNAVHVAIAQIAVVRTFSPNSATLTASMVHFLQVLASTINHESRTDVLLYGYATSADRAPGSILLSARRASAVASALHHDLVKLNDGGVVIHSLGEGRFSDSALTSFRVVEVFAN